MRTLRRKGEISEANFSLSYATSLKGGADSESLNRFAHER